jgi:hypothetical protein
VAATAVPGLARAVADAGFGDARVEFDAFLSGRLNHEKA